MEKENMQKLSEETMGSVTGGVGQFMRMMDPHENGAGVLEESDAVANCTDAANGLKSEITKDRISYVHEFNSGIGGANG